MTNRKSLRALTAAFALVALAACETTGVPASDAPGDTVKTVAKPKLTPISADHLMSSYFAANPGEKSVPLLEGRRQGFYLSKDGTITYSSFGAIKETLITTAVSLKDGNRICMEGTQRFSGACLDLYQVSSEKIRVRYEFGNGRFGFLNSRKLTF